MRDRTTHNLPARGKTTARGRESPSKGKGEKTLMSIDNRQKIAEKVLSTYSAPNTRAIPFLVQIKTKRGVKPSLSGIVSVSARDTVEARDKALKAAEKQSGRHKLAAEDFHVEAVRLTGEGI